MKRQLRRRGKQDLCGTIKQLLVPGVTPTVAKLLNTKVGAFGQVHQRLALVQCTDSGIYTFSNGSWSDIW